MEIEVKNRNLLFPESTVFDADENAAVWTFLLPEKVSGRAVETLTGELLVAADTGFADAIFAVRQGTRFTVTLPAGLFRGANSAMLQFALSAEGFAWHSNIVAAEVVRCLNAEQTLIDTQPSLITQIKVRLSSAENRLTTLENADLLSTMTALQTKQTAQDESISALRDQDAAIEAQIAELDSAKNIAIAADGKATGLTTGSLTAKKAECDGLGNVIADTYARKENEQIGAQANSKVNALISGDLTAKKAECDGLGRTIATTYATKSELQSGGSGGTGDAFADAPEGYNSAALLAEKVQAAQSGVNDLKAHQTWFTVDISAYVWDSMLDYGALNSRLAAIKNGLPLGVRGNIVFSNVEGDTGFLSSAEDIVWQNGMNYHFLKEETLSLGQLILNGVKDVSFYNFQVSAICEAPVLVLSGCQNVTFENCSFINQMHICATLENCSDLQFTHCYFERGTYQPYSTIAITDNGTAVRRIMMENCYICHRDMVAIDFANVANDNFFMRLENVRLPSNARISLSNCATSGHGTISFSVDESDLAAMATVNEIAATYALGTRRVPLSVGQAFALTLTGNTALILPEPEGLTRGTIIVYVEVAAEGISVDGGAPLWADGTVPAFDKVGQYRIVYDYNPVAKAWQGACTYFAAPTEE